MMGMGRESAIRLTGRGCLLPGNRGGRFAHDIVRTGWPLANLPGNAPSIILDPRTAVGLDFLYKVHHEAAPHSKTLVVFERHPKKVSA